MALADLFTSTISPIVNWAKQQNIPQAAGSLLAAYAIPALAGGLIRKPHRGQVQGMLAAPLINQAFDYLQRPQKIRDAMQLQQIQNQSLSMTPATPGATPVMDYNGIPMYSPRSFAQALSGLFNPSPLPEGINGTQPAPPAGTQIDPSSLKAVPTPLPQSAAMKFFGGLPYTPQGAGSIATLLQSQEQQQQENERYKQSLDILGTPGAQGADLVRVAKMDPKTGRMVFAWEQRRGAPPLDPALFAQSEQKMREEQLKNPGSQLRFRTGPRGQVMSDLVPPSGTPPPNPAAFTNSKAEILQLQKQSPGSQIAITTSAHGDLLYSLRPPSGTAPLDPAAQAATEAQMDDLAKKNPDLVRTYRSGKSGVSSALVPKRGTETKPPRIRRSKTTLPDGTPVEVEMIYNPATGKEEWNRDPDGNIVGFKLNDATTGLTRIALSSNLSEVQGRVTAGSKALNEAIGSTDTQENITRLTAELQAAKDDRERLYRAMGVPPLGMGGASPGGGFSEDDMKKLSDDLK